MADRNGGSLKSCGHQDGEAAAACASPDASGFAYHYRFSSEVRGADMSADTDSTSKVMPVADMLYKAAERFGLPVVILVMVLYWARTDIVQPLLDAHFEFIAQIVQGQKEHTQHVQEIGRKLDELITVSKSANQ